MVSKEDDDVSSGIQRAMQEGNIWLNEVFRFNNNSRRLFGKRGPRISKLEVVWASICLLLTAGIGYGMYSIFGGDGLFFFTWSPFAIAFWSILAGWFGRSIAFMSPLRRRTGEGTGIWFWMFIKRAISRISFLFARPTMYNKCISYAGKSDGSAMVIECIEWIGTSRAPRAPYSKDGEAYGNANFKLVPRGMPVVVPRDYHEAMRRGK